MKKKCLCLMLSAFLMATSTTPVWASVNVTNGESMEADAISDDFGNNGANVNASDGGEATLCVDNNVHATDTNGAANEVMAAVAVSADGGNASVTIGGDAIVQTDSVQLAATGIAVNTDNGGSAHIQAKGVTSESTEGYACGISVDARGDSATDVSIGSDGINTTGAGAEGINANIDGGIATINVDGNVNTQGTSNDVTANIGITGTSNNGSSLNIHVAGNVQTEGIDATGVKISATDASRANVNIDGNVTTTWTESAVNPGGLNLTATGADTELSARVGGDIDGNYGETATLGVVATSGAQINVVAEGTLTAGRESAIAFAGDPDNISLTIWKAELNNDEAIVKEVSYYENETTYSQTQRSEQLEQSIHYIIKVDTSQDITLDNITEQTYTDADGAVTSYNTAQEGDRVAVRLDIPYGYELKGAFSDKDRTCSLNRDASGDYYLIVPKGGGVYVNMWLVKKPMSRPSQNNESQLAQQEAQPAIEQETAPAQQLAQTAQLTVNTDTHGAVLNFLQNGAYSFDVSYALLQSYINMGISRLYVKAYTGDCVDFPLSDLQSYIQDGNVFTFIYDKNNSQLLINVNGIQKLSYIMSDPLNAGHDIEELIDAQRAANHETIESLKAQFEAFKQAQEKNNATLTNEKNALSNQLANTQKSLDEAVQVRDKYQEKYKNATKHGKNEAPSRAAQLSKNNAIGDGYGGYIAQGGHVQINGGKSNVTFTLAAPTAGVLSSANQYANSVGGTLLHCVTTSSPGVSFKTATVNFTVTDVYANDTIAVYQLQGKNWVQVLVPSVTDNHVTVNLTQHGPLAFVRVASVATATH